MKHALDVMAQVNTGGLDVEEIYYNSPAGVLYQQALEHEQGTQIVSSGALSVKSGKKKGGSPLDKRVVWEEESKDDIWWGKVNIALPEKSFMTNRERAVDYLNMQKRLYVVDGYGGWDPEYRVPVRVITSRAYHALFMQNMLVPPTPEELALPLHASANIGPDNDVSIFFGLSGTGKTTLSADPKRELIGDDEHVWHPSGVFNMEGGCYAKTIGLTREKEPEIFDAIRFGSVLENVIYDEDTKVDYDDVSITE